MPGCLSGPCGSPGTSHLFERAAIPRICAGGAGTGAIGALPQRNRFHWLVAPRSTIIQLSPVHTGRTGDPASALERLLDALVRRSASAGPPTP